ncbi:hypothetical protein ABZ092_35915 [Streptomyces bobili]|uniref:hypothetical protein n=1 Tax=Streptomyces bobili TaxID=67280 RepID=UPI0033A8180F
MLVLGPTGWIARPYVDEWGTIRTACDGTLSGDAVRDPLPEDARVEDGASGGVKELGSYSCDISTQTKHGRDRALPGLKAYTLRDDQDRALMRVLPEIGLESQAEMPQGPPGFIGRSAP